MQEIVEKRLTEVAERLLSGDGWMGITKNLLEGNFGKADEDCRDCGHPHRLHLEIQPGLYLSCDGKIVAG